MLEQLVETDDILQVEDLKKHFPVRGGVFGGITGKIKAVDGITFNVKRGETFSIVGESGCGKSTTGMCLLRLEEPTSGKILLNGQNINSKSKTQVREFRRNVQIIFQDPYSSLNPKHTIKRILSEPLVNNGLTSEKKVKDRVVSLLEMVGLGAHHLERYPHEFSGGQRQRIGIARAISLNPKLIICDEPVSALDVSIQSQILNLLQELQTKLNLTYIFISHDLSVVEHISDRVAVMYLGKIVEMGPRKEVFEDPRHPYTKALLSSVPVPDPNDLRKGKRIILQGDVPSLKNPPQGCSFHTRCPHKREICTKVIPKFTQVSDQHKTTCHLVESGVL
jgi:oligopeptide/dipeptide ABC transporter ATP-binding protein